MKALSASERRAAGACRCGAAPRRRISASHSLANCGSETQSFHMTEQQIIERINATTDARELTTQLQQICKMTDYIHELQEGQKQASLE
jgi:hypothetical protein